MLAEAGLRAEVEIDEVAEASAEDFACEDPYAGAEEVEHNTNLASTLSSIADVESQLEAAKEDEDDADLKARLSATLAAVADVEAQLAAAETELDSTLEPSGSALGVDSLGTGDASARVDAVELRHDATLDDAHALTQEAVAESSAHTGLAVDEPEDAGPSTSGPNLGGLLGGYDSEEEDETACLDEAPGVAQGVLEDHGPQEGDVAPGAVSSNGLPPANAELTSGCAVRIHGLQKTLHFNGHHGIVLRKEALVGDRWMVELQLGGGLKEVIVARRQNIIVEGEAEGALASAGRGGHQRATRGAGGTVASTADVTANRVPMQLGLEVGALVCIEGLSGAAHLNGQKGRLVRFDDSLGRWEVRLLADGTVKALKQQNLMMGSLGPVVGDDGVGESAASSVTAGVRQAPTQPGLEVGTLVRIEGLSGAAHLNGQQGQLVRFDDALGRWEVSLLADGKIKALKPRNLVVAPPRSAVDEDGDDESALGSDVTAAELTPTQPGLGIGALVRIEGLSGAAHLNGQQGRLVRFDDSLGRWEVRLLGDGAVKALRTQNFVVELHGAVASEDCSFESAPASEATMAEAALIQPGLEVGAFVRVKGLRSAPHLNGQNGQLVRFDDALGRWEVRLLADGAVKALKPQSLVVVPSSSTVGGEGGAESVPGVEPTTTDAVPTQPCLEVGAFVRIEGLSSAPHLNGQYGQLVQFDDALGRWEVRLLADGAVKALKPQNFVVETDDNFADAIDEGEAIDMEVEGASADEKERSEEEDDESDEGDGFEVGARVRIDGLKGAAHLNGQLGALHSFDSSSCRWQVELESDKTGALLAIKPENLTLEGRHDEVGADDAGAPDNSTDYSSMGDNELNAVLIQAELSGDADTAQKVRAVLQGEDDRPPIEEQMEVHADAVGAIIGRGGENIKRLIQETGVHMTFAPPDENRPGTRTLTLRGKKRALAAARRAVGSASAKELSAKTQGKGGKGQRRGGGCYMSEQAPGTGAGGEVGVCKWFAAGFCRNKTQGGKGCRNGLHDGPACVRAEQSWISEAPKAGTAGPPSRKPLLLLLDLEGGGNTEGRDGEDEIIEVPVLAMDSGTGKELGRFHRFARPGFWDREAASMRQRYRPEHFNTMSRAVPFPQVVDEIREWIGTLFQVPPSTVQANDFLFVTCGNWDVKTVIPRQCNKPVAGTVDFATQQMMFQRWSNLKEVFRDHYKIPQSSAPTGMRGMLKRLKIPLSGQHHLGMDDVTNLSKILRTIILDGEVLAPTGKAKPGVLTGGADGGAGKGGKGKWDGKKGKAGCGASKGGPFGRGAPPTFMPASTPSTARAGDVMSRVGGPFDFSMLVSASPQETPPQMNAQHGDLLGESPPEMSPPQGSPPPAKPSGPQKRQGEDWDEASDIDEEDFADLAASKAKRHAGEAGTLAGIFGDDAAETRKRSLGTDTGNESPPKLRKTSLSSLFAGLPQPKTACEDAPPISAMLAGLPKPKTASENSPGPE